jgi:site-specific DNA-methyltransferase (adenine-specific)
VTHRIERIGDCELHLGDCREVLPTLGRVDAIVSDPPYGMNWNTDSTRFTGGGRKRGEGRSDRMIAGDTSKFDPQPWLSFREVILWGSNHYAQELPVGQTLVWLKRYAHQYGSFLSDAEVGWQKGGHGVFCFHAPDSAGRRQKEFTGDPFGGETAHPTQKPVSLMIWCVERVKGDVVFDPYMGSGTTGIAALACGRKFIGVEIDPDYFDIACRRIEEAYKQPDMFVSAPSPKAEQLDLLGAAE